MAAAHGRDRSCRGGRGDRDRPLSALHPRSKNQTVVDSIFQSRTLVVLIRIVVVFVAGFVITSLLARIWRREWLAKAGPFEISDVMDLTGALDVAQKNLREAEDRMLTLTARIADSDRTIEDLIADLDSSQTDRQEVERETALLTARLVRRFSRLQMPVRNLTGRGRTVVQQDSQHS